MQIDPRTVAREIPGVLDEVFPQLTPGIVAHFNSSGTHFPIQDLSGELLLASQLQRSMLFELGYVLAEQILQDRLPVDWDNCFQEAVRRQRVYFDAEVPDALAYEDQKAAEIVGSNLARILINLSESKNSTLIIGPAIPGLEWIGAGRGDFSLANTLIEVKCTARRFSAADYRQIAIYWMLSYASSIEGRGDEWKDFILLNPRSGFMVALNFDTFLSSIGSGRTKLDILQLFQSLVGSRLTR